MAIDVYIQNESNRIKEHGMVFTSFIAYQHITVNHATPQSCSARKQMWAMQKLSLLPYWMNARALSLSISVQRLSLVNDGNYSRNLFIPSSDLDQLKENQ